MRYSHTTRRHEALGIANTFYNLTLFFPVSVFLKLPKDVLAQLFAQLASLCCSFARAAALEDAVRIFHVDFFC